jgi:hypothetical protein
MVVGGSGILLLYLVAILALAAIAYVLIGLVVGRK